MSFCIPPSLGSRFTTILRSYAQDEGLPFASVLTEAQIQQAANEEGVAFASGANAVYTPACRGWRWLPRGPAERQLWAVWGGYIVGCFALGVSTRITLGFVENAVELRLYPGLAVLTALAFFSLAANFWGYCAPIGLGFLALTFAMAADLRWAPLEFGTAWAAVLMLLGCRLRRLSRLRSDQ